MNTHEFYIRQTLRLATRGSGKTATNPLVGAVLVQMIGGSQTVIGLGYHAGFGKPHAEVEAIRRARRNGFSDLSNTILYVNLEPCCHHGKTPPCTDLIIQEKIPHVVFGTLDPYKKVAGKGAEVLRAHGTKVDFGFLDMECRALNKFFFKHVETGLPWVSLKLAQSLDGKIATTSGDSKWISSPTSRKHAHKLRKEYDAVLVGAETVIKDNPSLTVRLVKGRHPKRIIIDGRLRIPLNANVVTDALKRQTIVATASHSNPKKIRLLRSRGIKVLEFPAKKFEINFRAVLKKLAAEENIASVLVEGGSKIHGEFLKHRLADDVYAFIAPKIIGRGIPAMDAELTNKISKAVRLADYSVKTLGDDFLIHARITK